MVNSQKWVHGTLAANRFGADNVRCVRHVSVLFRKAFRHSTNGNGTERNKSYTSNIVGTEAVAARVLCTHFWVLTSVLISGFKSLSLLIYFRYDPNTCDEKWQKPIRNVVLWYTLWFNFILGSNFFFLCFKLIFIHNHTPKQREIKFDPRIKLNRNIHVAWYRYFPCLPSSDLDDNDGGLDHVRVKEKEGPDSNPQSPCVSEGHRMSRPVRLSRSMTVSEDDDDHMSDEEDFK